MPNETEDVNTGRLSLEEMAGAVEASQLSSSSNGANEADQTESSVGSADAKIKLNIGGATREVSLSELNELYAKKADLDAKQSLIEQGLAGIGEKHSLLKKFEALDEEQRDVVSNFISDPDSFLKRYSQEAEEPNEDTSGLDEILGRKNTREAQGLRSLQSELEQDRQELSRVVQYMKQQQAAQELKTRGESVAMEMSSWDVFKGENKRAVVARSMASRMINAELALSGGQGLPDIVASAAAIAQSMLDANDGLNAVDTSRFAVSSTGGLVPKVAPTGKDFENRSIARWIEEASREAQRI